MLLNFIIISDYIKPSSSNVLNVQNSSKNMEVSNPSVKESFKTMDTSDIMSPTHSDVNI